MTWVLVLLAQGTLHGQSTLSAQIGRGEALFQDATHGCATCHALGGKGTAVGPDLKGDARLSPRGIAMAIRSTVTQYVQIAKVKGGETYPAMPGAQDDKTVALWNLSKTPPEMQKLEKANVTLAPNAGWKHPPSQAKLSDEQMADLVAYIRYAGANNRAAVSPDEVK